MIFSSDQSAISHLLNHKPWGKNIMKTRNSHRTCGKLEHKMGCKCDLSPQHADASSASHTPTPWSLNLWTVGRVTIHSNAQGDMQVCEMSQVHGPGTQTANAAFIVRAVNAHETLINTLSQCKGYFDMQMKHLPTEATKIMLNDIVQAIAKAEGE